MIVSNRKPRIDHCYDAAMDQQRPLSERAAKRHWRITPQRRAVIQALDGPHRHMRAEEVHRRAQELVPEISLATVYNTLRELVELGEVREVRTGAGSVRYDPNAAPHHHLVCTRCERTFDVSPSGLDELVLAEPDRHGFSVSDVDVVFRGVCPTCRQNRGAGSTSED